MKTDYQIPEPYLFNPIKHHLGFIKEFINHNIDNYRSDDQSPIKNSLATEAILEMIEILRY